MVKELVKTVIFGATIGSVLFALEAYNSIQRDKNLEKIDRAYRKGQLMGEYHVYRQLDLYAASPVDIVHEIDRYIVCPYGDDTEVERFHFKVDAVK